mgnify:CR=1 FL=1
MFWLKVIKYTKLAAVWCRQYWRWLVLFFAFLIVYLTGRKHAKGIRIQAEMAKEFYEKEKESIQKAYELEIEKREEARKKYSDAVIKIEQEYEKRRKDLTHSKKEEVKRLVKKNSNNPDEIDSILERELGIKKI